MANEYEVPEIKVIEVQIEKGFVLQLHQFQEFRSIFS